MIIPQPRLTIQVIDVGLSREHLSACSIIPRLDSAEDAATEVAGPRIVIVTFRRQSNTQHFSNVPANIFECRLEQLESVTFITPCLIARENYTAVAAPH